MLIYSTIPDVYLDDMLRIDLGSNQNPWTQENLRSSYYQFQNLGLFQGNQLVAYIIFQQVTDEAEIIHFICDKPYQRQGFAAQLLYQWLKVLSDQSVKQFFLEVRAGNARAKRLYEKAGFLEVGRRNGYYTNKEDAIVMRLDNFSLKS